MGRITKRIGMERCVERGEAVSAYLELPLAERKQSPSQEPPPEVAVVSTDGGRLQIRDGRREEEESVIEERSDEARGKHWREDKIGVMLTMRSEVLASDPCPQIPENFVDPTRILRLARELKKRPAMGEDGGRRELQFGGRFFATPPSMRPSAGYRARSRRRSAAKAGAYNDDAIRRLAGSRPHVLHQILIRLFPKITQ
ncbi:MAG: hypothetical protein KatS3mg105_2143 [Gemmatales bacterium]|nr:MAG: hypothetical protein KatS3mg105_2143 [Gemmatales bacterium]